MSKHYKDMIKEINAGKNLEVVLPKYSSVLSTVFNEYATLQLSMEYFGLKEMNDEKLEAYHEVEGQLKQMNAMVDRIFVQGQGIGSREELITEIDQIRNCVIEKMEVLTMYADKLQIYEYVLNRKELEYVSEYPAVDEEAFKQRLVQYIFGSKDNYVINERIKEAIGQLPIRMLKSRYFDYVKDSLSIYTESDKSSVDSYLYMLRTCAMLYKPNRSTEYYSNLHEVVTKLASAPYDKLSKEEYQQLCSLVLDSSLFINQVTDIYLVVQKVLNYLYVYALTLPYAVDRDEVLSSSCTGIIAEVHNKFNSDLYEEDVMRIHEMFENIEGKQETIFDEYMYLASNLPTIKENNEQLVEAMNLTAVYECLYKAEKLCNTSVFIDIHNEQESFPVDALYIEHQTDKLIEELMGLFKENPQCINRAVMASTLSRMPVFFNNSDEVMEYINTSLEQCRNSEEKTVAMKLLMDCMDEDMNWSK